MMESKSFDSAPKDPLQEERDHLEYVLAQIRKQLKRDGTRLLETDEDEDADEALTADEIADATVAELARERFRKLRMATREPYFGRLDFLADGDARIDQMYIGKRGVDDPDTAERMILDWRAPAASLFYSFTGQGDEAAYESPEGPIHGQVYLKRNIVVRDGELQRVVDSYVHGQDTSATTDEFLLYRLAENKDSRLRDIVSTIQAEQNDIIRADKNLAVIIQGVAGSGKTTVALHRLAYLLYQHQERMSADRMAIFAPNAMFVDYISEVLPELGVGGIQQTTFADWALRILDYEVGLRDPSHRLRDWFGLKAAGARRAEYRDVEAKGALSCRDALEAFLKEFERTCIPEADFSPFEGHTLPLTDIVAWFRDEYSHYPLYQRRSRVLARVKRWMEIALKESSELDKKAQKRAATAKYRAYENLWPDFTPLALYRTFLDSQPGLGSASIHAPKKRGARYEVQAEDLAPMLYIHWRLQGVDPRDRFDHVVIDEAQDFSPFQIAVLRNYCPSGSMTILGDLSQSIHTYQGITDWDAFMSQFPEGHVGYYQLDVSYRSTFEIIEFANEIIRPFRQFREAKPVFRSGEEVVVEQVEWRTRLDQAVDKLSALHREASTVALLTRTEEDAHVYHHACLEAGVDAHLIDAKQSEYHGGISVVPIYLAKGLEFDSVLLVDVDEQHYDTSSLSAKLLYVGCTRALHRLHVHYTDALSPLIPRSDADERCGASG
ncbi:AAA family ATPase [Alicyclobacillus fastidiosus]|uniref:AAA family ATPase n=1 Tax=Alicyclobacillus fastidiosus TaxID=392011 RepID=A0ABY6ZE04_9BACL|nr:UvrD-helicase domain-containing protein [Alicyclobacillus fastidiosus]WAH40960.1 AAA family ATPase [Alicyclobacillus fastidiosus]